MSTRECPESSGLKAQRSRDALSQRYMSLQRKVDDLLFNLQLVEWDHRLIAHRDYRIVFAVDYMELFRFAYPDVELREAIEVAGLQPPEDKIREITNRRIARAYLLQGRKSHTSVVLLPPYETELRDHIRRPLQGGAASEFELARLRLAEVRMLREQVAKEIEDTPGVKEAFENYRGTGHVLEAHLDNLYSYFQRRFPPLICALLGYAPAGLQVLRQLFTAAPAPDGWTGVLLSSQMWPSLSDDLKQMVRTSTGTRWYDIYDEVRGRPCVDDRDARAIELVMRLNHGLKTHAELPKQFVVLVSGARSTEQVLRYDALKAGKPPLEYYGKGTFPVDELQTDVPILRTLDTLLCYLFYKGEDNERTLAAVREAQTRFSKVSDLKVMLERVVGQCRSCSSETERAACPIREQCDTTKSRLAEMESAIDGLHDASLFTRGAPFINGLVNLDAQLSGVKGAVRDLVAFIAKATDTVGPRVDRYRQSMYRRLDRGWRGFWRELHEAAGAFGVESADARVTLELNFLIRTRFRLIFHDRRIDQAFMHLRTAYEVPLSAPVQFQRRIRQHLHELVGLAGNEELGKERALLIAALFAAYGMYDQAINHCNIALRPDEWDPRLRKAEFRYLRLLARFMAIRAAKDWPRIIRLLRLTDYAAELSSGDPRFYHLKGRIAGFTRQNAPADFHRAPIDWDTAITACTRAHFMMSISDWRADKHLDAAVTNNLCWYLMKRGDPRDLTQAAVTARRLRGIIDGLADVDRMPEAYDTLAHAYQMEARQLSAAGDSAAQAKVQEAVDMLRLAVHHARMLREEPERIQQLEKAHAEFCREVGT